MPGKGYEIQRLQAQHREIIRLKTIGLTGKEISDQMGVTEATVSNTINSTVAQKRMEELQDGRDDSFMEAKERLEELLPQAIETLKLALDEDTEETSLMQKVKVAGEVLDRVGPSKTSRVESKTDLGAVTLELLSDVKELALRRQLSREAAIDVTPQVEAL